MHDHDGAINEIKGLSLNARNALSHVIRNGLMLIMVANRHNPSVDEEIRKLEEKIREVGL